MRAHLIWKNNEKFLAFGIAIRHKEMDVSFFSQKKRRIKVAIALVLSLLVHALVLWLMRSVMPKMDISEGANEPLTVSLAAPEQRQPAQPERQPTPAEPVERPITPPIERPRRLLSVPTPSSRSATVAPELPPLPPPPAPSANPPQEDMLSHINSRREQRQSEEAQERLLEATGGTGESDADRAKRIALANIKATSGAGKSSHSGGMFEITHLGLHDAEYIFNGWNKDFHQDAARQIEVRQGDKASIDIAVVDSMIDVIRQYEQGDFKFDSQRLGKVVTLSARSQDTPGLEEFLLLEFARDFNNGPAGPPPPQMQNPGRRRSG
jgi:hypothetical protein